MKQEGSLRNCCPPKRWVFERKRTAAGWCGSSSGLFIAALGDAGVTVVIPRLVPHFCWGKKVYFYKSFRSFFFFFLVCGAFDTFRSTVGHLLVGLGQEVFRRLYERVTETCLNHQFLMLKV